MNLEKMLEQQKKKGFKSKNPITKTLSFEEYLSNPNAPRPYNTEDPLANTQKIAHRDDSALNETAIEKTTQDASTVSIAVLPTQGRETHEQLSDTVASPKRHISDTSNQRSSLPNSSKATQNHHNIDTTETQTTTQNNKQQHVTTHEYFHYSQLTGNAKKIIDEIYHECIQSQKLETDFIEKNLFSQRVNVKIGSIRNTCNRLRERSFLDNFLTTKGRGSAWKFILNEKIFNHITVKNRKINDTISDTKDISSSSYNINNTTTTDLPSDWNQISMTELQDVLSKSSSTHQFFGVTQLKSIYKQGKLVAKDVQQAIEHFAYGLKYYSQDAPYKDMQKPAGILVDALKNGDIWEEPRYLNPDELVLKKIYDNLARKIEMQKRDIFKQWIEQDRSEKYERLKSKQPSTHYFGENEFIESARVEFEHNVWKNHKQQELISLMGEEHLDFIKKIQKILAC